MALSPPVRRSLRRTGRSQPHHALTGIKEMPFRFSRTPNFLSGSGWNHLRCPAQTFPTQHDSLHMQPAGTTQDRDLGFAFLPAWQAGRERLESNDDTLGGRTH
jgi:hypothetical protein